MNETLKNIIISTVRCFFVNVCDRSRKWDDFFNRVIFVASGQKMSIKLLFNLQKLLFSIPKEYLRAVIFSTSVSIDGVILHFDPTILTSEHGVSNCVIFLTVNIKLTDWTWIYIVGRLLCQKVREKFFSAMIYQ